MKKLLFILFFLSILVSPQTSIDSIISLNTFYKNNYNYSKAISLLQMAIKVNPQNAFLFYELGDAYLQLDNYELAKINFSKAYNLDSSNLVYTIKLADLFFTLDIVEEAEPLYRRALAVDSSNIYVLKNLGNCLLEKKEVVDADTFYTRAFLLDTLNASMLKRLINNRILLGDLNSADSLSDIGIYNFNDNPAFYKLKGDIHFKITKYNDSYTFSRRAMELGDSSKQTMLVNAFSAYYLTRNIDTNYFTKKYLETARSLFSKVLEDDPKNGLVTYYLGLVNFYQENFNEAIELFKKVEELIINGQIKQLYKFLGDSYLINNQPQEATDAFEKALVLNPVDDKILASTEHLYLDVFKDKKKLENVYNSLLEDKKTSDEMRTKIKARLSLIK